MELVERNVDGNVASVIRPELSATAPAVHELNEINEVPEVSNEHNEAPKVKDIANGTAGMECDENTDTGTDGEVDHDVDDQDVDGNDNETGDEVEDYMAKDEFEVKSSGDNEDVTPHHEVVDTVIEYDDNINFQIQAMMEDDDEISEEMTEIEHSNESEESSEDGGHTPPNRIMEF